LELQRVRKRRVGSTDVFTIPALIKKSVKILRDALNDPKLEWNVSAGRTPEGARWVLFKEVKNKE